MTDIYVGGMFFRGRGHAKRRPDPTLPDTDTGRGTPSNAGRKGAAVAGANRRAKTRARRALIPVEPWEPLLWEEFLG